MHTFFATLLSISVSSIFFTTVRADEPLKPDANGYIRHWLMLAPIALPETRAGGDLILEEQIKNEASLQPKANDKVTIRGKEHNWKPIVASTNHFDFNVILNSVNDHAVGYMATYIESAVELKDVIIAVGSNDEGRIYFNGIDIYAFTEARPLELDADKGKVTLKKGLNVIIFKIFNEQNSWQGAMRFLDKSGVPLTNLTVKLSP